MVGCNQCFMVWILNPHPSQNTCFDHPCPPNNSRPYNTYAKENQLICQCSRSCVYLALSCQGYRNPSFVNLLIVGFSQQELLILRVILGPVMCLSALNSSQIMCMMTLSWLGLSKNMGCIGMYIWSPKAENTHSPMTSHLLLKFPGPTWFIG